MAKGVHFNPVIIRNVDADVIARQHKSDILRSAGYTVIEAATVGEAEQLSRTERPTVVILDMRRAVDEALTLGRQFKATATPTLILLLAPAAMDPTRWEDSADICLREPFTPAQFLSQVKILVRLAQSEAAQLTLAMTGSSTAITERKRMAETLRHSEQRLALEAGRMGLWEWDVSANCSVWNEREYELLGLPAWNGIVDSTLFFEHVQPEDLPQLRQALATAIEQAGEFKQAFRIVRAGGAVRWLMGIGRMFPDADGQPSRMLGVNYDITEQKQIEAALKRSEERAWAQAEEITALLDATPAIIFIARDPDCHAITGSRAAHELLRMPPGVNLSKTAPDGDHLPYFKVLAQGVELSPEDLPVQQAARGVEVRDFEEEIVFDDGARVHLYGNATPLRDPTGKVRGAIAAFVDITKRKQAEEALREANRRKDEFLAMLAHELRNPLAPIRNAVQILRLLGPAEPKLQWARDVIARQVEHLVRLVDDLLDVSRLLRGKISLQRAPLMLSVLVQHAVETSRPLIEACRQTLEIKLPPEPVHLEGDLTRLAQVLANLLNNAAKYTDEGGHIGLAAETCPDEVIIRVWDTGVGIPASLLPHVFDLFTQAERTLDRSQGGLGLGLTVVKNLVELHGGKVEARSDGPGQGSEFIIRLPTRAVATGECPINEEEPVCILDDPPHYRILVVDDNVDVAESVAILLGLEGHEVRTVHTGAAALALAPAFQPQIILLDLGLPEMDGYEVARRLRADPATQAVPLIALTGYSQPEDQKRSQSAGFDAHLVKPVDPVALQQLVVALGRKGSLDKDRRA